MAVTTIPKATSFPRAKDVLNRTFRNPKFNVGRMLARSIVIMVVGAGILSWFPGIVPTLVLSSLLEFRAAARDQKLAQPRSPRYKDVTVNE